MKVNRKLIISIIGAILIVVAAIVATMLVKHRAEQQQVTINIKQPVTVDVYLASDVNSEHGIDENAKPLTTLTQTGSVKLGKGSYVALSRENKDYTVDRETFGVEDTSVTVTIDPAYTDAKLQSMVPSIKPAIVAALTKAYPQITNLYAIEDGWLYMQGDWYGTKLNYIGSDTKASDTLRVILHKENGDWKVAIAPDIMLSGSQHPEIPREIVSSLDAKE